MGVRLRLRGDSRKCWDIAKSGAAKELRMFIASIQCRQADDAWEIKDKNLQDMGWDDF